MWDEQSIRKVFALLVVLLLFCVIGYALLPYLNAFFGAFILYVLFKPIYQRFTKKWRWGKNKSAIAIILLTIIIILIPLSFLFGILIDQAKGIIAQREVIINSISSIDTFFPDIDVPGKIRELLTEAGKVLTNLLVSIFQQVGNKVISLTIMYFVLYYLLVSDEKTMNSYCRALIPFNKKNSEKLLKEFQSVTYSTIISTGLIALLQGVLLTITFAIFGIPGAVLWGFIGVILSFIPMVGTPILWIPAGILSMIQGRTGPAIGIFIAGVIMSSVDNFVRPVLQKKVGEMHPLVSLLGVFIGISMFGLLGVVIGPILLSLLLLTSRMFSEEYLH